MTPCPHCSLRALQSVPTISGHILGICPPEAALDSSPTSYECMTCGRRWSARDHYAHWPVRMHMNWTLDAQGHRWRCTTHVIQQGWHDVAVRSFFRVIRLGVFLLIIGKPRRTL